MNSTPPAGRGGNATRGSQSIQPPPDKTPGVLPVACGRGPTPPLSTSANHLLGPGVPGDRRSAGQAPVDTQDLSYIERLADFHLQRAKAQLDETQKPPPDGKPPMEDKKETPQALATRVDPEPVVPSAPDAPQPIAAPQGESKESPFSAIRRTWHESNDASADQVLAEYMRGNSKWPPTPGVVLREQLDGRLVEAFLDVMLPQGRLPLKIPDLPLWVGRDVHGGATPYFAASVLGAMGTGGISTGLLLQVDTPHTALQWRRAVVSRALKPGASFVLIQAEDLRGFSLLLAPKSKPATIAQRAGQALQQLMSEKHSTSVSGKTFVPLSVMAAHLKRGHTVLIRALWRDSDRTVDLCLAAGFERQTGSGALVFQSSWAPPLTQGGDVLWPPDMLGVVAGMACPLQALCVTTLRGGKDPLYEFHLDIHQTDCRVAFARSAHDTKRSS